MARNGFKILDCDLHICEPIDLWQRYMLPKYRDDAPVGRPLEHRPFHDLNMLHRGETYSPYGRFDSTIEDEEAGFVHLARVHGRYQQFCEFQKRGWGPGTQIEAMDIEGIDMAMLFPSLALTAMGKEYDSDGLAADVAHAYNDWMAEFCAYSSERLLGAGILMPQAIDEAVAEVRRVRRELGFKAVVIRPNPVCGRNWHDPAYEPLWAACEEEELLVGFHEGIPCLLPHGVAQRFDGRYEDDWMTDHVARHPHEMQYTILCLVMGGVLERFSGATSCLPRSKLQLGATLAVAYGRALRGTRRHRQKNAASSAQRILLETVFCVGGPRRRDRGSHHGTGLPVTWFFPPTICIPIAFTRMRPRRSPRVIG